MSVDSKMTAIADAIRDKTGSTELMELDDMAAAIPDVYDAGHINGYDAGILALWDIVTQSGKRTNLAYVFARWGGETIRPPFKIIPTQADHMFIDCPDLKVIEKQYFDLSQTTAGISAFCNNCQNLEIVEDINFNGAQSYYQAFANSKKLHTIERIPIEEKTTINEAFVRCTNLQNVTFDGVIGTDISFSYSPLTVESTKSVITHLKDYSGTESEYTYTVTFNSTAFSALTAEGTTSPNGNTWAEYIDDLKWNLVLA